MLDNNVADAVVNDCDPTPFLQVQENIENEDTEEKKPSPRCEVEDNDLNPEIKLQESQDFKNPNLETQINVLFNVPNSVLSGASTFGSLLYSAANYASQVVKGASSKILETVEEHTIIGNFNKEQTSFINKNLNTSQVNLPPWVGCEEEDDIKEKCLSLSTDQRNFLKSPPIGTTFEFNYDVSYPAAMAIMKEDPRLENIRYELVPKRISEENFWKNYFYRVSLILQSCDKNISLATEHPSRDSLSRQLSEEDWVKEIEEELNSLEESAFLN